MSAPVFKPNLKAEPWLAVAEAIRAKGVRVTPFRLGFTVGECGFDLCCPYLLARSAGNFNDGVKWGRQNRAVLVARGLAAATKAGA